MYHKQKSKMHDPLFHEHFHHRSCHLTCQSICISVLCKVIRHNKHMVSAMIRDCHNVQQMHSHTITFIMYINMPL